MRRLINYYGRAEPYSGKLSHYAQLANAFGSLKRIFSELEDHFASAAISKTTLPGETSPSTGAKHKSKAALKEKSESKAHTKGEAQGKRKKQ